MRAEVDINEIDIAKVTLGAPARVIPDAYPDRAFDANLVKIYPEADRQKGTVKVEVRLNHPDLAIVKPEMSVRVNFSASAVRTEQKPALLVPKKAIMTEDHASYVWTIRDGAAARLPIKRGRELEDGVEVRDGLNDGELIIVEPPPGLKQGQKVVPKPA
jgi:RND family efflux transporter MFP subunit